MKNAETTRAGAITAALTALLAGCAHLDAAKDDSGFVPLAEAVPDAILELRYCSTYNFVGDRWRRSDRRRGSMRASVGARPAPTSTRPASPT